MPDNREILKAFQGAWGAQDVDAMVDLVTDDIEYRASVGPEPGQTWVGKADMRRGIAAMLAHDRGSTAILDAPYFFADHAFCRWTYAGERLETGCDLFTFRGGLIAVKDAYRKCRV